MFGDIRIKKKDILEGINQIDLLDVEGRVDEELVRKREGLRNELEEVLLLERRSMCQKMKIRWAKEGDVNSKLFFKVVNGRKRRNFVTELEGEGGLLIRDEDRIVDEISSFYERL